MSDLTADQRENLLLVVRNANRRAVGVEFLGTWGSRAARLREAGLLEARPMHRPLGGVAYWLTDAGRRALIAQQAKP